MSLQRAVAECQQKIAAFVQQVQQGQGMGGGGGGGAGVGMRLGAGGGTGMMDPSSDADMARYMRTQGMQVPGGYRGGSDDMVRAMMMAAAGGRGAAGPGDSGGFLSMPGGASSFAPFARHPPDALGMSRGPDRMGGGMWQPGQMDSFGAGGTMRQGMFETGGGAADSKPFDEDLMFPPMHPPVEQPPQPRQQQQQQQQQHDPSVNRSADENPETSHESKQRVVRFADEEPARQPCKPPPVPSTNVHHVREAKACSVCQHTERGNVLNCLVPVVALITDAGGRRGIP